MARLFGAPSEPDDNNRREPRTAVSRPARLIPQGAPPVPCTIADLSSRGARIKLKAGPVPPRGLLVDLHAGCAYEVQTAWRQDVWYRDPEMGLRILRRHDLNAMVPAHLRVAKAIWLQERRSA
jgi:hypothetical protein